MKEKFCKYCGLELEGEKCSCKDFVESKQKNNLRNKETKKCDTCGKVIDKNAKFCSYCGVTTRKIKKEEKLVRELQGEFAEDVLEKKGIKYFSIEKIMNKLFTPVTKIISCVLLGAIICLIIYNFAKPHIDEYQAKKYLESQKKELEEEMSEKMSIEESIMETTIVEPTTQTIIEMKKGWVKQEGFYYCIDENGNPVVDEWVKAKNSKGEEKYYYFDIDGKLVVNSWIDGEYYVGADGAMLVNTKTPDGAEVDENGLVKIKEQNKPIEKETMVYYEAPNTEETIISYQKSSSAGVIKGIKQGKDYELYINDLIQIKDSIKKDDERFNLTYYCPRFNGVSSVEVVTINEKIEEKFRGEFKETLLDIARNKSALPRSLVLNTVEQRQLNQNRLMFLIYGKLTPRHGLYEAYKFRVTYDRKSQNVYILDISTVN